MPTPSLTATTPARTKPAGDHVFVAPVVREVPRPAGEPPSFASVW